MEYKSVKVPAWVHDNAKLALDDLARKGTGRIPTALRTPEIDELLKQGPSLNAVIALGVEALKQRLEAADEAAGFVGRRRAKG